MRPPPIASQDASSELLGSMRRVQTLALVLTGIAALAANRADGPGNSVPWMSALQVPMLIAVAAWWPGRGLPRTRPFWLVLGTHAALSIVIGLIVGNSWGAVGIALGGVAYALVVGVLHRASSPTWVPRTPGGVVRLTGISFVASPIPLWLMGYPGVSYALVFQEPQIGLLAAERGAIATMIGLNTLLVLFYAPRAAAPWIAKPAAPFIVAATFAGAVGLSLTHHPEIAWTLTLGPLAAALTMTPRMVASLLIAMRIVTLRTPYAPALEPLLGIPPAVFVDLLIAFTVQTALAVSIARDQRCRLDDEVLTLFATEERQGALLSTVLGSMTDAVVVTDSHGTVDVANKAATDLLGEPARALELEPQSGSISPVLSADGDTRQVRVFRTPLAVEGRTLTLHLLDDATQELAHQRSLETFAGTVAHDLKGPLTAMLGWLDTAEDQLIDGDTISARSALARADTATGRMDAMIDEYLAFAVAQEGAPAAVEVAVAEMMTELAGLYQGSEVEIHWTTPHLVYADPALFRQLLINLITNSVKYSRPGAGTQIEVTSAIEPGGLVRIEVADHGLGLQPGDEERIFDAFRRSAKDSKTHQGIGLGLALCRSIVERHGGSISAASNDWGGATFRFTLPGAGP